MEINGKSELQQNDDPEISQEDSEFIDSKDGLKCTCEEILAAK